MKLRAPAKINLTLEILDRRADGYHGLRSVMVPVELADNMTIEPAERFSFSCDDPSLADESNLVVRAVRAVDPTISVAIALSKSVPSQAGLGGGSSDAATVLLALMNGIVTLPKIDWMTVARSLGSDVPFFLAQSGALVEGTGERVTAVGALPDWHVLIVKPPVAVSTAAAYAEIDKHARPTRARNTSVSLQMVMALQRRDFERVCDLLSNDFEAPVVGMAPAVGQALQALRAQGTSALLSGSGSAVFALAQSAEELARLDRALDLPDTFLRFRTRFLQSAAWKE